MTGPAETEIVYDRQPAMFGDRPILFLFLGLVVLASLFGLVAYNMPLLAMPALLAVLCYAVWYLGTLSNRLTVDHRRVRFRKGLLSKRIKEINIRQIRAMEVDQTLAQRMTNVGTIRIYTTGDDPEIVLGGLPNPYELKSAISGNPEGNPS